MEDNNIEKTKLPVFCDDCHVDFLLELSTDFDRLIKDELVPEESDTTGTSNVPLEIQKKPTGCLRNSSLEIF